MDEQRSALPPALEQAHPETGWPGGWYVYENGRVVGPYAADVAFAMDVETETGKPRLVSRKGFTQWYALKDLSEIFRMTAQLGRQASEHGLLSESQLVGLMSSRAAAGRVGDLRSEMPDRAGRLGMTEEAKAIKVTGRKLDGAPSSAGATAGLAVQAPVAETLMAPAPAAAALGAKAPVVARSDLALTTGSPKALGKSAKGAKPLGKHARDAKAMTKGEAKLGSTSVARETAAPAKAPLGVKAARPSAKSALMQEYFHARARLRLGKLRNPWLSAFLGVPLSLGVFWAVWFRDTGREVAAHALNRTKSTLPPAVLAMVPGLHFYMVYRLASLIRDMEVQNRYRSVSPGMATLFAIVPPVAMAYLQDALNRHWLLHAKHAAVNRAAS